MASAVLFVVSALGGCSVLRQPSRKPATAYPRCPEATRWVTGNVTGTQGASSSAGSNETWNLTGFTHTTTPDPTRYPFRLERVRNVCIVGGRIIGNIPDTYSRTQWYDGIGLPSSAPKYDGDAFRIVQKNGWALIRDAYVERVSDAYNPQGPRTARIYLDHVHAKYIRDDCIENEGSGNVERPMNLVINRSLFDGCFTGIAERPMYAGGSVQNGSGPQSLTIDNTLMYIQPQPLGPNYCSDAQVTTGRCKATSRSNVWMGAHGIWKWSRAAASKVTIRNSVFKLDMASYTSCGAQVWPAGTYQNVTLVWAGAGPYATAGGCKNTLPAGVTLTTDNSVWSKAKAAWLEGSTTPASRQTSTATPTRVSAGVVRHRVGGTLATLSGHRVAGASMTLQRRSVGSSRWVPVTRARTSSVGVARVTVRPARTSYFRWVFRGEAHHAASRSAAVRVRR